MFGRSFQSMPKARSVALAERGEATTRTSGSRRSVLSVTASAPSRAEMLSRIENAAAREIEHPPLGCGIGRSLATVKGLRRREIDAAPAELACAHREVHVLVVDEEALVEPAERLEHAAANQEECAHDLIDRARVVMRPFGHKVRRENRRQQPVEPHTVADHGQGSRLPRGVARDLAVRIEELDADDADACVLGGLQIVRRPFEASPA